MANADMTRLINNARIGLPGALDSVIQLELFAVLNEFFQSSNIWYEDIPFAVTPTSNTYYQAPDDYTYEITASTGVINRVLYVRDSSGNSVSVGMPTPGEIILVMSPNVADTFTARCALTVTDPTTRDGYPDCPAWIINKYGNDLLDGVLGRMMGQQSKPYSKPQLAQYHLRRFMGAISQAKVEAQHQNVYRGQSWRYPQSFSRRRFATF